MERISFGKMQNPIRGLLHGSAALVSVVGVIALIASADGPGLVSVAIVYGVALVGVFTTSTLYHCLPWSVVWKARFQRLDHTWIYALVAATFTALLVGSLDGPAVGIGVALIWGIGALGALKEFRPRTRNKLTLLAQVALGAGLMAPLFLMLGAMEPKLFVLTVAGSIAYLVGMIMMIRHWPRLLPRIFSYHEVFHIIVIAAAVTHFLVVRELISAI
ncbi:MAG TPA: hemolysin III family protein [Acidimicrobiia bacterium]|nr:hemolysin III family protein [Acidimicrobiia bacterium]